VSSFDIECTSKDGSFPQAQRKEDKIIQIGTTTRVYGEKNCFVRHIVTLKECDEIPDLEDEKVIVESVATEKELIRTWAKHIQKIDPDVIIGYNIFGFDWKYVYDRAELIGIPRAISKINRVSEKDCKLKSQRLSSSAMGHNLLHYPLISGRVQIDLLHVVRREHNLTSYKLDNVANHFLGLRKNDLPPHKIFEKYHNGTPEDIKIIAEYCIQDCILVNDLFDKLDIFVNSLGMSNVCLVPISLLFTRGQGIKVFSKIAEKCLGRDTLFPTLVKPDFTKGVGYEGAIVLDPTSGFYEDPIAVLDYGSLYPSSIIEYDISYETLLKNNDEFRDLDYRYNTITFDQLDESKKKIGETTCVYAESSSGKGIVPSLLMDLLSARKAAKKQMKNANDPFKKSVYNGKQLALKITANSVYGYTGAKFSDLRLQNLAASTTAVGRLRIHTAKNLAEEKFPGAKCIYGDSVAPDTPLLLRCEGKIIIERIDKLVKEWNPKIKGKQHAPPFKKFEVWTEKGWTEIKNVMRHEVSKKMYRVLTSNGA
jgi:DNA polymerase delta subunit 1